MAKAKKPESSPAKKGAGASKAAAAKSKSASPKASSAVGANPFVDTNLAAQAAARMLFAKKNDSGQKKPTGGGGMIDQLKADLNKHPSSSVAGVLDKSAPPGSKRPHLPFGAGGKQVAHNQTFGADVTRSGVPRRTPG